MAVTRAQLNTAKATVVDRLFLRYPQFHSTMIRVVVQAYKQGNAAEREVLEALLQEAYQALYSRTPVGDRDFWHWLERGCQDVPDDPTTGVRFGDAFHARSLQIESLAEVR